MQKSKKMGVIQLTTLTAINMMGSGIILLPANLASIGTISIFGWILAALGATLLAYAFSICGMFSRKGGGMGGYAEYRFGIRGNFVANFTYAISLVIANIAIATGVVSYMTYVFNWTLSPAGTCLVTLLVLMSAASISFFGPKAAGKFSTLGISCILTSIGGLILFGWYFFNPSIYMAAWNPSHLPFTAALRDSIAVILWAFLGLETACANSSAVENPEKNVPIAVLSSSPGWCNILHAEGKEIMFPLLRKYPVQFITRNAPDSLQGLKEMAALSQKSIIGELSLDSLSQDRRDYLEHEVYMALKETQGKRLIISPGTALPDSITQETTTWLKHMLSEFEHKLLR